MEYRTAGAAGPQSHGPADGEGLGDGEGDGDGDGEGDVLGCEGDGLALPRGRGVLVWVAAVWAVAVASGLLPPALVGCGAGLWLALLLGPAPVAPASAASVLVAWMLGPGLAVPERDGPLPVLSEYAATVPPSTASTATPASTQRRRR